MEQPVSRDIGGKPVIVWPDQSTANRIRTNVCHFLILALGMSQTMIEKIPLPIDPSDSCRNPLKIAD
jgi:hypothetical protein